jgi:hypothetical protein
VFFDTAASREMGMSIIPNIDSLTLQYDTYKSYGIWSCNADVVADPHDVVYVADRWLPGKTTSTYREYARLRSSQ